MAETTAALLLFLLPLAYSPGPGNLVFAAAGARFGMRATLPASLGYHLATLIVTVAIGAGLAEAIARAEALMHALGWAGTLYLVWLAAGFWRAGALGDTAAEARPLGVAGGAALLLLNPKAYAIILLMFATFLPASEGGGFALVLWISVVFTLNNLVAFTLWTGLGERLAARFREEGEARLLNRAFALLLLGVALWLMPWRPAPLSG